MSWEKCNGLGCFTHAPPSAVGPRNKTFKGNLDLCVNMEETGADMAAADVAPSRAEGPPADVLGELKQQRQALKAALKRVTKTVKSETKKQKRLIAKAGRLSKDDLLFLIARQQSQPRP